MRQHTQWLNTLPAFVLMLALLSGCFASGFMGNGSFQLTESYPDAESYQISGAFTYRAEDISAVYVYWRAGQVEVVESDDDVLHVRESGENLPEEITMRYLLDDGTLQIRFCASDKPVIGNSDDKYLTLEVPKGIDLSVQTTSATIRADALEQKNLLISAHSGSTKLGTVAAETVNLSSSSGAIHVESITTESLECSASSGSVNIQDVSTETASIQTSSGSVALGLTTVSQANIRTSSGKTTLRLPENGAAVSHTASSGKLHTALPYERKGDLYVFGKGESQITVIGSSGNLEIVK